MQISNNHVSLILRAEKNGITITQALALNQRTLGSACTQTNQHGFLLYFDAEVNRFRPTQEALDLVYADLTRLAKITKGLSRGVITRYRLHRKLNQGNVTPIRKRA